MVTFLKLGEYGRLGNQLFQYAALRGLSSKNGYEIKIPSLESKNWHGQDCLLNEFNIKCDFFSKNDVQKVKYFYNEPSWKKYDENFFNLRDNTSILGFFQSMYYFEHIQEEIKIELTPKTKYLDEGKNYIKYLKEKHDCEIVSVHVRRGDNMTNGQTELINAYKQNGIYQNYFERAKKIFDNKKVKFLIFSGGQRFNEDNSSDIEWCKEFFTGDEFIFSEGQNQISDFSRIMSCDHNILSHASSFGWWASFVNPNKNKIVIGPEWYHPDEPNLKREKFYPKNYILL
jgi:hypothetical protein